MIKNLYTYVQRGFSGQFIKKYISIYYFKISTKRNPKWREYIFSNEKPKSFQGPKAGPKPQPIRTHFIHTTLLHRVGKNQPKKIGAPLNRILDPPLRCHYLLVPVVVIQLFADSEMSFTSSSHCCNTTVP